MGRFSRPLTCYANHQGVMPSKLFSSIKQQLSNTSSNQKFHYEDQAKTHRYTQIILLALDLKRGLDLVRRYLPDLDTMSSIRKQATKTLSLLCHLSDPIQLRILSCSIQHLESTTTPKRTLNDLNHSSSSILTYRFGKTPRFFDSGWNEKLKVPGPQDYKPKEPEKYKNTKWSLGSSQRGLSFFDKMVVPGPGSYQTESIIGSGNKNKVSHQSTSILSLVEQTTPSSTLKHLEQDSISNQKINSKL